jgi:serine/threonine protein kinase
MYLVFEWLNRTILDEINRNRRVNSQDAKKIIYQMVKACAHMHSKGVIHRDIKPENMMLSRNGVLKVCDLGSARIL